MTVHGEDDSRDPAARAVILFFRDREGNWVVRELWPIYFVFCRITNVGLLTFLRPAGPKIFQDEEGCIFPRKWAISKKKWAISNNKWAIK